MKMYENIGNWLLPKTSRLICLALLSVAALIYSSAYAGDYVIGTGDVLDIIVWKQPDLTKTITVPAGGAITYPLLGRIKAAGLTADQLAGTIAEKLETGYLRKPQVTVLIKEYNSQKIMVFGLVDRPGIYKLKGPTPVLDLISRIGGITLGKVDQLVISRKNKEEVATAKGKKKMVEKVKTITVDLRALLLKGDLSQNVVICAGDTIYVSASKRSKIYILGQVKNPGPYEVSGQVTVLGVINLAGGITNLAASNRIKVIRETKSGKQTIKVSMGRIMKGDKKQDIVVKPGDIIIVPESWL